MEAAKATAAAWANTPEGVEARLLSEPFFIREVWRKKLSGYGSTVKPDTPMIFLWGQ
ncbi:bacteriophage replication GPA [Escherichia coli DEC12A]|nr:bacteriophage replication GPA [Escherichia coli DEC12A]